MRPVTTVPRPEIEKMSSIGIRNVLVDRPLRHRDVGVQRVHQLADLGAPLAVHRAALQSLQRRAPDDRNVVAREVVGGQQLAQLQLHQVQQLRIVHHVALVHEHHDVGHAHLTGQQDVLARLRHRTVGRRHHQDRAVHLRRAGDHVLHVVGVARAVHVRVVAVLALVLHVGGRDRDAALPLLRSLVDLVEGHEARQTLRRQDPRDRRRQRRLAVIDVTDRADVDVRLRTLELFLAHDLSLCFRFWRLSLSRRPWPRPLR